MFIEAENKIRYGKVNICFIASAIENEVYTKWCMHRGMAYTGKVKGRITV